MTAALLLAAVLPAASARAASPAAVVKSREWIVRRGEHREEEFVGAVRYDAGGTHLSSDWALFRHKTRDWTAKGGVVVVRELADGTRLEGRGEKAGHDESGRRGYLEPAPGGRVRFTREVPSEGPDRGEAGRVEWEGEERAVLTGGAKVEGPRLELSSDKAVYEKPSARLTLTGGRPVLRKVEGEWTTALKADEVVAFNAPRRIEARGGVVGWLLFKDEKTLKELAK